jgi:hypothetical protein
MGLCSSCQRVHLLAVLRATRVRRLAYVCEMMAFLLQAPPCGLPLLARADPRQRGPRGVPKKSTDQRTLEAAQQLSHETYCKARYALPEAVCFAQLRAAGAAPMDIDKVAESGGEDPPMRLNFQAFDVHFRHQHCIEFVSLVQGMECAKVCPFVSEDLSLIE